MKKINSITIRHLPDYDADLSWIGTFSDKPEEFAVEVKDGPRNSYKYFNPQKGVCETQADAQRDYETMMKYERGELYCIGVKATAEIGTSDEDGECWSLNKISSAGLWGIEQGYKGDNEDLKDIEADQIQDLKAILLSLGFTDKEIVAAPVDHSDK